MKIAVFSDIHGNKYALKGILNDIKRNNIDEIYCLGDVIGLGPNPKQCLDMIIKNKVQMVLGNHELYCLKGAENIQDNLSVEELEHHHWIKNQINSQQYEYLSKLPIKREITLNNTLITFQHFLILDLNTPYPFENLDIIKSKKLKAIIDSLPLSINFIGHEHQTFEIDNKLIDVGSSGCVHGNETFYTILSFENNEIKIEKKYLKYNQKSFIKKLKIKKYPNKEMISKVFFGL